MEKGGKENKSKSVFLSPRILHHISAIIFNNCFLTKQKNTIICMQVSLHVMYKSGEKRFLFPYIRITT